MSEDYCKMGKLPNQEAAPETRFQTPRAVTERYYDEELDSQIQAVRPPRIKKLR
jgi:hypothetical protein